MSAPIAILSTGLVSAVGLTAPATCAAIRAGLTNPTQTRFLSGGAWIMGHEVPLVRPWRGRARLVRMAAMAIGECLAGIPREDWVEIPLLLCVAEPERPGRLAGLDNELFGEVQKAAGAEFAAHSLVIAHGRVSIGVALSHARQLIAEQGVQVVLIAAADSLLDWATLSVYDRDQRLLTSDNSNGFMPGEGASALLVGPPHAGNQLLCTGLGFATERAHIDSGDPLRGDGLCQAIGAALQDAGCQIQDMHCRVTDLSGEQYYFKEAELAVTRILRVRKEQFDIWHPAEYIGESGAVAGLASVIVANAACRKGYSLGPNLLIHAANDAGQRTAGVLQFRAT